MSYKLGNAVKASVVFAGEDDVEFDPDPVTVLVRLPDESESAHVFGTDPDVIRDSEGNFHYWIATPAAGTYAYRWKGTDGFGNEVANEGTFDVDESSFDAP